MIVPTVTEILAPWSGLERVYGPTLTLAAAKGTRVHRVCAAWVMGYYVPPLEAEVQGFYDSFRRWFDLAVDEVLAVEPELMDVALPLVGHPDFILIFKGDHYPAILDNKTPIARSRTWRLQLAAYKQLALPTYEIDRTASLRLSPTGGLAKLDEYTPSWERDWPIFLACHRAFRFFRHGFSGPSNYSEGEPTQ